MRRRFGRGRRGGGSAEAKNPPINGARSFEQITALGIVGEGELKPVDVDGVPESFAVVGEGTGAKGNALLVGFSPGCGGNAALAVVAEAQRRAANGFDGEVVAIAPQWTTLARRRLALLAPQGYRLGALAASSLGDAAIVAEVPGGGAPTRPRQLAGALERGAEREVFLRALAAFEGLAAKHGGGVRATSSRVDLVLLGRCSAALRVNPASPEGGGSVVLETILPERSSETLEPATLATAMDRLEGLLRKRLNDRRAQGGEAGLRATTAPALAEAAGVREVSRWPLGGSDPDVLDFAGVTDAGQLVIGALRERMDLVSLAAILDGVSTLRDALPVLFADLDAAWNWSSPQLVLSASDFDDATLQVIGALAIDATLFDLQIRRGRSPEIALRSASQGGADASTPTRVDDLRESIEAADVREDPRRGGRRRRRSGSRSSGATASGRDRGERSGGDPSSPVANAAVETAAAGVEERGFEEISMFDLEEEPRSVDSDSGPRRRRRRGRRRRPGNGGADDGSRGESASQLDSDSDSEAGGGVAPDAPAAPEEEENGDLLEEDGALDDITDVSDTLAKIAVELDPDEPDAPVEPIYEDDEEDSAGISAEVAASAAVDEREAEVRRRPRKRAAILAHADRASVLAAVLLARDLRLLEGVWIYPQTELMTFFRSVATDFGNDTPIHVVGFTASPAREVLQAAGLYAGRLEWFDHHDWPPEDLGALRESIGRDCVHVHPGMRSPLAAVLAECNRRSRFSDKLVELQTGRFSDHDYERWGRVWWHRLGELANQSGERRADLEPLLVGRPSDLARQAALSPPPPLPPEVEFVSSRDFRLVHFGGYTVVVVVTPADLDDSLAARIARERYEAQISLSFQEGQETILLGSDEGRTQRSLDLTKMVEHLASKHSWAEALPDEDRAASVRIHGLASEEGRLDEVIREIALGRSVLEG